MALAKTERVRYQEAFEVEVVLAIDRDIYLSQVEPTKALRRREEQDVRSVVYFLAVRSQHKTDDYQIVR